MPLTLKSQVALTFGMAKQEYNHVLALEDWWAERTAASKCCICLSLQSMFAFLYTQFQIYRFAFIMQ